MKTPRTDKFTGLLVSHSWLDSMFGEMVKLERETTSLQSTLAERDATIARLEKRLANETIMHAACFALTDGARLTDISTENQSPAVRAVANIVGQTIELKQQRDAALAVVGQMKPLLEQHHIYRKRHDTESKEGYTDFPICRESKEALTAATRLLLEHGREF